MPRKSKYGGIAVDIPTNVSVDPNGYVYYNTTSEVKRDGNGKILYNSHKKVLIGKTISDPKLWKNNRKMTPNDNFYSLFTVTSKDDRPQRAIHDDHIFVGMHVLMDKLANECGLLDDLYETFGKEDSQKLLDLAHYILSSKSAIMQHARSWGRIHSTFQYKMPEDDKISNFFSSNVSLSEINLFKSLWTLRNISDGHVYFCYDSTNVNSQAEGITLVEKGHAKDDPSLEQVNVDYVVRQDDGLPLTFCEFPGSINDMKEAKEMIAFLRELLEYAESHQHHGSKRTIEDLFITLICDRGYISQENVEELDKAGIGFILMLRKNMGITERLISEHINDVKKPRNYIRDRDQYVLVVPGHLFDGDERTRYFYIIWDAKAEKDNRKKLFSELDKYDLELKKLRDRKTLVTELDLKKYYDYYNFRLAMDGTVDVKKRGKGVGTTEATAYRVEEFVRNEEIIEHDLMQCGYHIIVSSCELSAAELLMRYSKRDCVEKVFMALKSHLGMDKPGVHTDDALHAKSMVWFITAIIYSIIQHRTEPLRKKNASDFTTPCVIETIDEICADMNLLKGKFERRYALTAQQEKILNIFGIKGDVIDDYIDKLKR